MGGAPQGRRALPRRTLAIAPVTVAHPSLTPVAAMPIVIVVAAVPAITPATVMPAVVPGMTHTHRDDDRR